MINKTTFLQLILPNSDITNWGQVLNNNFSKIDQKFFEYNNDINSIKAGLENISFNIEEKQRYCKIYTEDSILVIETGYLQTIDNITTFISFEKYYNDDVLNKLSFNNIKDYSAFIVYEDTETLQYFPGFSTSVNFKAGDIIVKKTEINESYNTQSIFILIPQGVGGWYEPSINVIEDHILWKKKISVEARDNITTSFPKRDVLCSLSIVELTASNVPISLGISAATIQNVSIFFLLTDETQKVFHNALVDYTINYDNNNNISVIPTFNEIPSSYKLYMCYVLKSV